MASSGRVTVLMEMLRVKSLLLIEKSTIQFHVYVYIHYIYILVQICLIQETQK